MFRNAFTPPLSGEYSSKFFPRINGMTFDDDSTFESTLRALCGPRMGENDYINLYVERYEAGLFDIASIATPSNAIVVVDIRGDRDEACSAVSMLREKLDSKQIRGYESATRLKNAEEFFGRIMQCCIIVDSEKRCTVIVVQNLTLQKWHFLQCLIPKYLPWVFPEPHFDEREMRLLVSLQKTSAGEYCRVMDEYEEILGIKSGKIWEMISRVSVEFRRQQLRAVETEMDDRRDRIQYLREQLAECYAALDDLNVRHLGLKCRSEEDGQNELADYFMHMKCLNLVSAGDGRLGFIVKTTLDYFDPDLYDRVVNRDGSYMNEGAASGVFRDELNRRKLLDHIFGPESDLQIRIQAYYEIAVYGGIAVQSGYPYGDNSYVPNPHIHYYSCLGDYERLIHDCIDRGDTIGAVDQCIASCKSVNLGESITASHLIDELFTTSSPIINLPDGQNVSPESALKWIEEQEGI